MTNSRDGLRDDLKAVAREFERLYLTDVWCEAEMVRIFRPSRSPEGHRRGKQAEWEVRQRLQGEWMPVIGGRSWEISPRDARTVEEFESAPILYDAKGTPITNSVGQSLIASQGWIEAGQVYKIDHRSPRILEAIQRVNRIVKAYSADIACLLKIPPPGRTVTFYETPWLSIVNRVAELAGSANLPAPEWKVRTGNGSWTIDAWRQRAKFGDSWFTPEDEAEIGDEPEVVCCERKAFLRDSELAIEWLLNRLQSLATVEPQSVGPLALDMVGLIDAVETELAAWLVLEANGNSNLDYYESQSWEAWIAELRNGRLTDAPETKSKLLKAAADVVMRQWTATGDKAGAASLDSQGASCPPYRPSNLQSSRAIRGQPLQYLTGAVSRTTAADSDGELSPELDAVLSLRQRQDFLQLNPDLPPEFLDRERAKVCDELETAGITYTGDPLEWLRSLWGHREVDRRFRELREPPKASADCENDNDRKTKTIGWEPAGPLPDDGLFPDQKLMIWDGKSYERLTGRMVRFLDLLIKARELGREGVGRSELTARQFGNLEDGVCKSIFKLNRKGWPPEHPVRAVVDESGGYYSLVDPKA